MLAKRTERHYGILVFSLGFIILFQSLAIGRDASRLETPALSILMPFDEEEGAAKPDAESPSASPAMPENEQPVMEMALSDQLASQGLFLDRVVGETNRELAYTVQKEDTFFSIARQFGMSARELAKANGLKRLWAPVGAELRIPRPLDEAIPAFLTDEAGHHYVHTLKKGETIAKIASRFHALADEIRADNGLEAGEEPEAGSEIGIRIPEVIQYKIRPGDSFWKLSRLYEVDLETLMELNEAAARALRVGSMVEIPVRDPAILARVWKKRSANTSAFSYPLQGRLTDRFGSRIHPIYRVKNFHSGIDIAAPRGTTIRSARNGVVKFSGYKRGYGRVIVIRHPGGMETWYGHCSKLLIRRGAEVKSGDKIARVGSTGAATGAHLHFEIRRNSKPVNPLKYLRG